MPTTEIHSAAIHLATKDIRQRLRDRSAILVAVVLPLALAFILSLVFGSDSGTSPFRYAVVDADNGPIAGAFVTDVLGPLDRKKIVEVRTVGSVEEAERLVDRGTVDAAFVLPAGFSAASQADAPAHIDVIGSVDSPTASETARSIAGSFTAELNGVRLATAAVAHAPPTAGSGPASDPASGTDPGPERMAAITAKARAMAPPVALADRSAKTKILDTKTYVSAGMAIFFVFFTVQFGVSSLIDERDNGTLHRLLAMPIRPSAVLVAKLLTSLVIGVVSVAVLVVATTLLLGAKWGSPVGVAMLVVAAVLAATGVTSLIAGLSKTAEQANSWQSIISIVLGLLGGCFFPIGQVGALSTVTLITPHAWFLRGLAELADGGGAAGVLPAVGGMLAFAVVTGGIGFARLRAVVQP